MKRFLKLISIVALFFGVNVRSQTLSIVDLDATEFPRVKAKIFAFDADGKQILTLTPSDFMVRENGHIRNVSRILCPNSAPAEIISSVLTIDVSISMLGNGMSIAKKAATGWIGAMQGNSECAITGFDHSNYLNQDFTTNRVKLLNAINGLQPHGGTDYDYGLIKPPAGSLLVSKAGKFKKIVIFVTDGLPNQEPPVSEIIQTAKSQGTSVYAVVLGIQCPQSLKEISTKTGGKWFEGIDSEEEIRKVYAEILALAGGGKACEIEWESGALCQDGLTFGELEYVHTTATFSYQPPMTARAALEFLPNILSFRNAVPGIKTEAMLKVTARNADFSVTDILTSNAAFSITPSQFTLLSGETQDVKIAFTPPDSGFSFSTLTFVNNLCPVSYSGNGGFIGKSPTQRTLNLTKPKGGEEFVVGSDTTIEWEGIPENQNVSLEFSTDNGKTWRQIARDVKGLRYRWTKIPTPESNRCYVRIGQSDNANGSLQRTLNGHRGSVKNVQWSPDGTRLVTAGSDSTAILWNAKTGEKIMVFSGHKGEINDVQWSPDGTRIATASDDNTTIIWNATSGAKVHTLIGHSSATLVVQWNLSGTQIATAGKDNTAIIWNAASGAILHTLNAHSYYINCIEWSPNGKYIATASDDNTAIIWDIASGKMVYTLTGHTNAVHSIHWNSDGSRLVSASRDRSAIIWSASTGGRILTLNGHSNDVLNAVWNADATRIATISLDNSGAVWNASTGERTLSLLGHSDWMRDVEWSPDGTRIATGNWDKSSIVWNAADGTQIATLLGHSERVNKTRWSPDGEYLASAGDDGIVNIWFMSSSSLQEDTSESFSIVAPMAQVHDVDLGKAFVGIPKDSLISSLIFNPASYKFRVDSLYFSGADSAAFSLVSGFPKYDVQAKSGKNVEIRFLPKRVGIHRATLHILTQSDTLFVQIQAEGIAESLKVLAEFLDFGRVEVSNQKVFQDTILLQNISDAPIRVKSIAQSGPDFVQFEILGDQFPFVLQKNEVRRLSVKFKPIAVGRTSGGITFDYDGGVSAKKVSLFGTGISPTIFVPHDSAFAGKLCRLKLVLRGVNADGISAIAPNFVATLRFHQSILAPVEPSTWSVDSDSISVTVNGKINSSEEIADIPVLGKLGIIEESAVEIIHFTLQDSVGNDVDCPFIQEAGVFKLLGICKEGGTRFFSAEEKAALLTIDAHSRSGVLLVEANLIELGKTILRLCDFSGKIVYEKQLENITGRVEIPIEIQHLSKGLYFVVLQTPTIRHIGKTVLMK